MTQAQHTPGPWRISPAGVGFEVEALVDGEMATVAQAQQLRWNDRETGHAERMANARLMRAAPDLLAALERVEWSPKGHCPECRGTPFKDHQKGCSIRAAIAKAKRETE